MITCPAVRGATNWYSPAFSPRTKLFYVMTVEDCGPIARRKQGGFGFLNNPKDPSLKYLRAFNIETGATAWEIQQTGPAERNYSGVLATAGDLVFYGESSGGFCGGGCEDRRHALAPGSRRYWKGSPDDLHGGWPSVRRDRFRLEHPVLRAARQLTWGRFPSALGYTGFSFSIPVQIVDLAP